MAVRLDAAGDYLQRTANLPTTTAFTVCGWSRVVTDQGALVYQPIAVNLNGSFDAWYLYWSNGTFSSQMRVGCAVGGVESSGTALGSRPAAGTDFFWYIKCSGTGAGLLEAGWRPADSNTFVTATATMSASVGTLNDLRLGNVIATYYMDGRFWAAKCWDRALTAAELLIESYYAQPMFPASVNFWWPLPNTSNTNDISGNGRNATVGGTLATEDGVWGQWQPSPQIIFPAASGISGTFAVTETNDAISASGTTTILGSFARTATDDTLSASGTTTVLGSLAITTGDDTLTASGTVGSPVDGTFAVTEVDDTMSASGTTTIVGSLALTTTADVLSATGTTTVVGTMTVTVANDTLSANGTTTIVGSVSITEANDTMVASGSVGSGVEGTFSVTGQNDTMSASGTTTLVGTFTVTGTNDILSATGTTTVLGTLAVTLNNDTLVANGIVGTPPDVNTWRALTNVGR